MRTSSTPPPPPGLNELGGWIRGITLTLTVALPLLIPVAVGAQAAAHADRDAPYPLEVVPVSVRADGWVRPNSAESDGSLAVLVETVSEALGSTNSIPAFVLVGWCTGEAARATAMGGCEKIRNVQERVELEDGTGGTKSTTCSLVSSVTVPLFSLGLPIPIPGLSVGPSLSAVVKICNYGDCGITVIGDWVV